MVFNVTQQNAAKYEDILHLRSVYNSISDSMMTCISYDPPNKSEAGYRKRVGCNIKKYDSLQRHWCSGGQQHTQYKGLYDSYTEPELSVCWWLPDLEEHPVKLLQLQVSLRSNDLMFWTVHLHDRDAFVPGFGLLFGSTFEAIPSKPGILSVTQFHSRMRLPEHESS